MTNFESLPTIEQSNLSAYWDIVRRLEPEFYLLRLALQETEVNTMVIPRVIRAISNLSEGTGYGRVSIYMSDHKITQIKTEESDQFNDSAIIDTK
jgi:hypothetical protein